MTFITKRHQRRRELRIITFVSCLMSCLLFGDMTVQKEISWICLTWGLKTFVLQSKETSLFLSANCLFFPGVDPLVILEFFLPDDDNVDFISLSHPFSLRCCRNCCSSCSLPCHFSFCRVNLLSSHKRVMTCVFEGSLCKKTMRTRDNEILEYETIETDSSLYQWRQPFTVSFVPMLPLHIRTLLQLLRQP